MQNIFGCLGKKLPPPKFGSSKNFPEKSAKIPPGQEDKEAPGLDFFGRGQFFTREISKSSHRIHFKPSPNESPMHVVCAIPIRMSRKKIAASKIWLIEKNRKNQRKIRPEEELGVPLPRLFRPRAIFHTRDLEI